MMAAPVAQGQDDGEGRDLLLEYAQILDSGNGRDVTRFLEEHSENERFAQATYMLHLMFNPAFSFTAQLKSLRARHG